MFDLKGKIFFRFLGISQSLPVTSYVKMIDIWMIFTMSVPFIEVGLHAGYELLKHRLSSPQRVSPGSSAVLKTTQRSSLPLWANLFLQLVIPILAIIFCTTFWIVGLFSFYFPKINQNLQMSNCLGYDIPA